MIYDSAKYIAQCNKNKKERLLTSLFVPYDVLFSNEFLRDLSRLWSLRDIAPDPNNLPWIEKN